MKKITIATKSLKRKLSPVILSFAEKSLEENKIMIFKAKKNLFSTLFGKDIPEKKNLSNKSFPSFSETKVSIINKISPLKLSNWVKFPFLLLRTGTQKKNYLVKGGK